MGNDQLRKQRRGQREDELPHRFCGQCHALCDEADEICFDCGAQRPAGGWGSLRHRSAAEGYGLEEPVESFDDLSEQHDVPPTGAFEPETLDSGVLDEREQPDEHRQPEALGRTHHGAPGARERRDSASMPGVRQTNPPGFQRASTSPKFDQDVRDIPAPKTVQLLPDGPGPIQEVRDEAHRRGDARSQDEVGIAFARSVRTCGASSEDAIGFVDTHNEIWAVAPKALDHDALLPVCTLRGRVTAIAPATAATFVGLADGTVNRMSPEGLGLQSLFRDEHGHAICLLSASRAADVVLAGTADGTLYLGTFEEPDGRWIALHANRPVAATAVSPTGGVFAAASTSGLIRVAAVESPARALAKLAVDAPVVDLALSNDGHLLAALLEDGRIPVFHVLRGARISALCPSCPRPDTLFFSRGNILHGLSTAGRRIACYNLTTGEPVHSR